MCPVQPAIREVCVFGTDRDGKPFFETVHVLVNGAELTLEGLGCALKPNDIVGLRDAGQKSRFRVVWVGGKGTPHEGKAGLVALAIKKSEGPIPEKSARPPRTSPAGSERRRYPRIRCRGRVEFSREGSTDMDVGRLQVLGEGGCYVATLHTPPCLSSLHLVVQAEGLELRASGIVRDSHEGYGMGIAFGEMNPTHRARVSEWIFRHSQE